MKFSLALSLNVGSNPIKGSLRFSLEVTFAMSYKILVRPMDISVSMQRLAKNPVFFLLEQLVHESINKVPLLVCDDMIDPRYLILPISLTHSLLLDQLEGPLL